MFRSLQAFPTEHVQKIKASGKRGQHSKEAVLAQDEPSASSTENIKKMIASSKKLSGSINKAVLAQKAPKKNSEARNAKEWVLKNVTSELSAYIEIIVQELFRLLAWEIPQGKTRPAQTNEDSSKLKVASELLKNYAPLWKDETEYKALKKSNKIVIPPQFGMILLFSYFFNETDLKPLHIGQAGSKIDSDWALSMLQDARFCKGNEITSDNINALPYPNINAIQWLDSIVNGDPQDKKQLIFSGLESNPTFRQSVNEGMLRLLLLSQAMIEFFVKAYVKKDALAEKIINFLNLRFNELRLAALQNQSFKAYMASDKAQKVVSPLAERINSFKTIGSAGVIPEEHQEQVYVSIKTAFKELERPAKKTSAHLANTCASASSPTNKDQAAITHSLSRRR